MCLIFCDTNYFGKESFSNHPVTKKAPAWTGQTNLVFRLISFERFIYEVEKTRARQENLWDVL